MSQKTIQTYETVWKRRILPPTGTFTGHRAPNRLDCPTGCAAVDFMLMGELPLEYPRNTFDDISRAFDYKATEALYITIPDISESGLLYTSVMVTVKMFVMTVLYGSLIKLLILIGYQLLTYTLCKTAMSAWNHLMESFTKETLLLMI